MCSAPSCTRVLSARLEYEGVHPRFFMCHVLGNARGEEHLLDLPGCSGLRMRMLTSAGEVQTALVQRGRGSGRVRGAASWAVRLAVPGPTLSCWSAVSI